MTYISSLLLLVGDDDIEGVLLIDEVNCFLFSASFDSKLVLALSGLEGDEGLVDKEAFEDEEGVGNFLRLSSFFESVLL